MSSPSPAAYAADSSRRGLALLSLLVVLAGGVGWYWYQRTHRVEVPAIDPSGMEPAVAAALEAARADVVRDPQSAAAWGQVGLLFFAHDMYVECVPWLVRAAERDPTDGRWPYFHGLAVLKDQPDEGIALLTRASTISPRDALIKLRLAEAYWEAGRAEEAGPLFDAVLQTHPELPHALLGRGRVRLRNGDARGAIEPLTQASASSATAKPALFALAQAHDQLGDEAAAAEHRRRSAAAPREIGWPDPKIAEVARLMTGLQARLRVANTAISHNKLPEAIAALRQILRDSPDSPEALLALSRALARTGELEEAAGHLQRVIDQEPDSVEGNFLLGGVHLVRKDYPAAEERYRRVLALRPSYVEAHYNLAQCRRHLGDRDGAISALRQTVRLRPDLAIAQRVLGELLLEANRAEEAIEPLTALTALEPGNQDAHALLEKARTAAANRDN